MRNLRESGIDIIGELPWGAHIACLYSSWEDVLKVIVPYIHAGLRNNEFCVWIYSNETDYRSIRNALGTRIPYLEERIRNGQLILIPYTECYMKNGCFSETRLIQYWNNMVEDALKKNFDGLRTVGDAAWVGKDRLRDVYHYEHVLNERTPELPFIKACLYPKGDMDIFDMAEIIGSHGYILAKREGSLQLIQNVELNVRDKQLEESRAKYEQLIQLLPDSILLHDREKVYYCNPSAVRLHEMRDTHELLGKAVSEFFPQEERESIDHFIEEVMQDKNKPHYLKSRILGSNGETKPVEIITTGCSMKKDNILLSVVRDVSPFQKITELQEILKSHEALLNDTLEYDKMRTEFFSNISHELRTPLNVILSVIQLLKLQNDMINNDLKGSRYLKMMQQNCFRLLRLVNNLIDITKIDAHYFQIHLQNYAIVDLIEQITMSVVEYGQQKGITILFDTDVEDKVIPCDPDQIERIILNLLSNAIKFTPSGGSIWVTIKDRKEKLMISIKDTGIGIPADKQEAIFNRFQQVEHSLIRKSEGSGIGLSLVKALVEMHNGKITLHSEEGKGSEFIIELPCSTSLQMDDSSQSAYSSNYHSHVDRLNIELSDIYS